MSAAQDAPSSVKRSLLSSFLPSYVFYSLALYLVFGLALGIENLLYFLTLEHFLRSILWILPAYVANASPVVVGKVLLSRNRKLHPMDFEKHFIDGRSIFGKNKTFEGFVFGFAAGSSTALLLHLLGLHNVTEGGLLALGALFGDLAGAFIKRRMGLEPGDPAWILDQVDFLIGSLITRMVFLGLPPPGFVFIILMVTPLIHMFTNILAYLLRLKNVPW
jgi:CDP-2,3-bis-(O-geranylgeranyl)-sn-glycerol synthase